MSRGTFFLERIRLVCFEHLVAELGIRDWLFETQEIRHLFYIVSIVHLSLCSSSNRMKVLTEHLLPIGTAIFHVKTHFMRFFKGFWSWDWHWQPETFLYQNYKIKYHHNILDLKDLVAQTTSTHTHIDKGDTFGN